MLGDRLGVPISPHQAPAPAPLALVVLVSSKAEATIASESMHTRGHGASLAPGPALTWVEATITSS